MKRFTQMLVQALSNERAKRFRRAGNAYITTSGGEVTVDDSLFLRQLLVTITNNICQ